LSIFLERFWGKYIIIWIQRRLFNKECEDLCFLNFVVREKHYIVKLSEVDCEKTLLNTLFLLDLHFIPRKWHFFGQFFTPLKFVSGYL
jgi:hypothetical protein